MDRRIFLVTLAGGLLAAPVGVEAQAGKCTGVAFLGSTSGTMDPTSEYLSDYGCRLAYGYVTSWHDLDQLGNASRPCRMRELSLIAAPIATGWRESERTRSFRVAGAAAASGTSWSSGLPSGAAWCGGGEPARPRAHRLLLGRAPRKKS